MAFGSNWIKLDWMGWDGMGCDRPIQAGEHISRCVSGGGCSMVSTDFLVIVLPATSS